MTTIKECCICKDWQLEEVPYRTPTRQERIDYHDTGVKITHRYCPSCYDRENSKLEEELARERK